MTVEIKNNVSDYPDLTVGEPYFMIGIEADGYRLLNDCCSQSMILSVVSSGCRLELSNTR